LAQARRAHSFEGTVFHKNQQKQSQSGFLKNKNKRVKWRGIKPLRDSVPKGTSGIFHRHSGAIPQLF